MAGRGKKKEIKAKEVVEKNKGTNQLELTQNKKQIDDLEEDNESINIHQIEPKKNKIKLDSNTLASSYFGQFSKSGNNSKNTKVM